MGIGGGECENLFILLVFDMERRKRAAVGNYLLFILSIEYRLAAHPRGQAAHWGRKGRAVQTERKPGARGLAGSSSLPASARK